MFDCVNEIAYDERSCACFAIKLLTFYPTKVEKKLINSKQNDIKGLTENMIFFLLLRSERYR